MSRWMDGWIGWNWILSKKVHVLTPPFSKLAPTSTMEAVQTFGRKVLIECDSGNQRD